MYSRDPRQKVNTRGLPTVFTMGYPRKVVKVNLLSRIRFIWVFNQTRHLLPDVISRLTVFESVRSDYQILVSFLQLITTDSFRVISFPPYKFLTLYHYFLFTDLEMRTLLWLTKLFHHWEIWKKIILRCRVWIVHKLSAYRNLLELQQVSVYKWFPGK